MVAFCFIKFDWKNSIFFLTFDQFDSFITNQLVKCIVDRGKRKWNESNYSEISNIKLSYIHEETLFLLSLAYLENLCAFLNFIHMPVHLIISLLAICVTSFFFLISFYYSYFILYLFYYAAFYFIILIIVCLVDELVVIS